ncbi:MAG TPA: GGDEF domain-containing protein [Pseudonocardia sp.]|nr:GGDEF domain-containing protein [Pseudonocardia sp.]
MSPERGRDADRPPLRGPSGLRGWRLPARVVRPVLLVDAAAAGLLAAGLVHGPLPTPDELGFAAAVLLLAVVHAEASVRVERERRRLGEAEQVDLSAVWTFAGALVLPGAYAALVAVVVVFHLWARVWRPSVPLHRQVHAAAAVALACMVTAAVLDGVDPGPGPAHHELWVLLTAVLTFTAVSTVLTAVAPADRPRLAMILARRDEHVLEFGLRCLGALAAVALTTSPWTVLFVLPPLFALLRAVLIRPLVTAASTDGKTGLLNAPAWYAEADRILRSPGACGVLVVDLDHFKAVNDTHGHVVGDRVLAAVAAVLRDGVRGHDVVGRLGGEEFVVLPLAATYGTRSVELEVVAERIRARVAALSVEVDPPSGPIVISDLTVSVGGAVAPPAGTDLVTLLQTADAALYAAKDAGRDRVRIRVAPPARQVRVPSAEGGAVPE